MSGDYSWLLGLFSNIWGLAFVVLLLGGSIFVHEMGHFLAARWRGLKVDRFSIGFGPRIFGWTGRDGVEYRVSWLPLGGYVALPQLADMRGIEGDPSDDARDLPSISYLDKIIVVTAGVVFNLLLAVVLSLVLWQLGKPVPASSDTTVVGYVTHTMEELREGVPAREQPTHLPHAPKPDNTPAPAFAAGLQPGDRILAIDGAPVNSFQDIPADIALGAGRDAQDRPKVSVTFERAGVKKTIDVLPALVATNTRSNDTIRQIGIAPAQKMLVDDVALKSPALRAGLRHGDEILAVNGQQIYSRDNMNDLMDAAGSAPLVFSIKRGDKTIEMPLQPARIPMTTPLATITIKDTAAGGVNDATLDILPIYKHDLTNANLMADSTTPAQKLLVWNVESQHGAFGNLQPGDYLLKVNGQDVSSIQQVVDALKATPTGQSASLAFASESTHENNTTTLPVGILATVTPPMEVSRLGIYLSDSMATDYITPPQQFADAFKQIFGMLSSLFNPHSDIGIQHLTGPVGISRIIFQFSILDVRVALWFAFIINVNLAILNLLPIPVLDGGHILFFTISRVFRRELPVNFVAYAQSMCMVMLMCLMLYVVINDSKRWIGDHERDQEMQLDDLYFLHGDQMDYPASATTDVAPVPVVPVMTKP